MKLTHILALIGIAAIANHFGLFSRFGLDLSKLKPQSPIATESTPNPNECPYSYSEVFVFTLTEVGADLPENCLKRDGGDI